jgi:hypothetical protein
VCGHKGAALRYPGWRNHVVGVQPFPTECMTRTSSDVATEKREYQWAITLIRQRGKFLGYVEAPDCESAIKVAIKYFD